MPGSVLTLVLPPMFRTGTFLIVLLTLRGMRDIVSTMILAEPLDVRSVILLFQDFPTLLARVVSSIPMKGMLMKCV